MRIASAKVLVAVCLLASCEAATDLVLPPRLESPREQYRASLEHFGLAETALGRDWVDAGDRALRAPIAIDLPHRETAYFPADSAVALGYRFRGQRGRRITATLTVAGIARARVYADLYRLSPDSADSPRLVATLDSTAASFSWEPRRDRDFVLRVQPELLRSGSITVEVRSEPALAFPVDGRAWNDVQSIFGDPRDAGARDHHGVDIFAPRGTPTLAAAAGRVSRVRETPRGGRVVWLRDEARSMSLYYAHLDRQAVASGQWVEVGDTLGFVGNSGNARTTPPHLHFGIYRRGEGPTDPDPWLRAWEPEVTEVSADTSALGTRMRIAVAGASVERPTRPRAAGPDAEASGASGEGPSQATIPERTIVRVLAAVADRYRVALPDGHVGYLRARDLERAIEPLGTMTLEGRALRAAPHPQAPVIATPAAEADGVILGVFGDQALVRGPGGVEGWSAMSALD
ncbi:MAG TPA: M23 family metallopeptidase [Longimicrobiales bacterium]|nr:M23 family metallopeptidase [Longimicrobiales bacterium]